MSPNIITAPKLPKLHIVCKVRDLLRSVLLSMLCRISQTMNNFDQLWSRNNTWRPD